MQIKYIMLTLMMANYYSAVSPHILTSSHTDSSYQYCIKILEHSIINYLCPIRNISSENYEFEGNKLEWKQSIVKKCCVKPCSIAELTQLCY